MNSFTINFVYSHTFGKQVVKTVETQIIISVIVVVVVYREDDSDINTDISFCLPLFPYPFLHD